MYTNLFVRPQTPTAAAENLSEDCIFSGKLLRWGRNGALPGPATQAVQSSRQRMALFQPRGMAALPTASESRGWLNIHRFLRETPVIR